MADPTRLRILKALTTCLEEITPANGYAHDLSGKVFRGRDMFGDSDPLPMISILEAIEEEEQVPSPAASPMSTGPWTLQIQGFIEDDMHNPSDPAHFLMADVKKRLIQERIRDRQYDIFGMGKTVTELRLSRGVVRPPGDAVSDKAYFWLRMTLTVVENLNDPFA